MRTIGIVTVGRSDYSIYLPILRKIQNEPELKLHLIVSGMHLSQEFGLTVRTIESDGFKVGERVEMLLSSDTPEGIAKSMGLGTILFAQAYGRLRPDILVVLGDRFEMHAAAVAALPFKIPVAHIHGGELTQGAIDDALRHSITKLSHLHFVSTQEYAQRIIQMGEEPWRVVVSGAPGLDNLRSCKLLPAHKLESKYGFPLERAPLLATFHPVTLEYEQTGWQTNELLAALEKCKLPIIFTSPNADTNGRVIRQMIEDFVRTHPSAWLVPDFDPQGYFSMMACSAAMVGNSSSGIVEAASFMLPVVNIGNRQKGRIRAINVIDVDYPCADILRGIQKACAPEFRARLRDLSNPYGDGHASDVIVQHLKNIDLDGYLVVKRFIDTSVVLSGERGPANA